MSHLTTVKTTIRDKDILRDTLEAMGWSVKEGNLTLKGLTASESISILASKGGRYGIGFREAEDGTLELIADWWGIKRELGFGEDELRNMITQQYAKAKVVKEASRLGYSIALDEVEENGSIRLVMRKWQ